MGDASGSGSRRLWIRDPLAILRTLAHGIDATISAERIAAALAWRRRRFEHGLVAVDPAILTSWTSPSE